ncbi:MAG: RNA polymerase sigma factor [Woeseia sp.]|nr:RNA polymerase sigma factor [Woeseia sp.]NNL55795.1 RNA polymerase sigma factor [Woeseia sp.]
MADRSSEVVYAEDRQMAQRLLAGDEAAFRQFFDEHYGRLYRFALSRLGGDQVAAEDIVQQTLSKALRKLASYKAESQLQTWLCAICRNDIADWYRARGRYEERIVLAEDLPGIRAAVDSFQAPAAADPVKNFQRTESVRLIQVALDRLPVNYGNALEWKYVEGYTSREIAEKLDIGYEAAQSLLARAKRAFADVYSELSEAAILTAPRG